MGPFIFCVLGLKRLLMREKRWFMLYLVFVVVLGMIHSIWLMLGVIILLSVINKNVKWRLLKKAFLTLLVFNGTVTLSYLLYALFVPVDTSILLLLNLRALAITLLTFTLMHHINFHKVLEFSHKGSVLYAFTYSQMMLSKKMLQAYYSALISRSASMKRCIRKEHLKPLLETLFATMLHQSKEQSLGLRSRGLIND